MRKKEIEKLVFDISESIVENMEFDLIDVEYVKEGPHMYLRIFIDKPGGVTIDDCQNASKLISEKLDEKDPIKSNYFLEVSSPGLDRPLKETRDLEKALGKDVEISLYRTINGKKKYLGELKDFDNNEIEIESENGNIKFNRNDIAKINLAIKF